jgi:glycosyltransferase involved in cell wall biosynthesis
VLSLATQLRRTRRSSDVLQTVQWTDAILASWLAGLAARTVVVWAARGDAADAVSRAGWLGRLRRRLLSGVRHVALTEEIAAELRALGFPAAAVIPVAVDLAYFRPASASERAEARTGFALSEEFVVLYVGHLRALKRVDALVEAFATLVRETPARLLIVGGSRGAPDDVEPSLRDQIERLRLTSLVTFAGVLSDTRPAYWAADAFVLPSSREGMPNTLLEALACGVPSVAPPSAGGDAVLVGGAGVIPPSNSAVDLVAALRALCAEDTLRSDVIRRGRERVAAYDVGAVADAYERIFRELEAPAPS